MPTKYETIRSELYRRLCDGVYPIGSRLPTDDELAKAFSVNRHTVRHAVSFLADAGYLRRSPRRGTQVVSRPDAHNRSGTVRIQYRYLGAAAGQDCPRTRAAQHIIEQFARLHPHIHVSLSPQPYDGPSHVSSARELLESGEVIVSRYTYVADHARNDLLVPLDSFGDILDVCAALDGRLVYRTADAAGAWHIHALPVQVSSWMLPVNRSLLRGLGVDDLGRLRTWRGFLETCEEVTRRGVPAVGFELVGGPQFVTRFFPYFYSANGGKMLMDPAARRVQLDAPGNVRTLDFLRELYARQCCHADPEASGFLEGRCAFRLSNTAISLRLAEGQLPGAEFDAVPFPVPETGAPSYTVLRGEFVGIAAPTVRTAQDRQAAWEFVKFLLSPAAQAIAFREARELPARLDQAPAVSATEGMERKFFEYGLRHGLPTFDLPRNEEIHSVLQRVMLRAVTGVCPPAQALAEGQDMLKSYLIGPPLRNGARLEHSMAS